MGKRIVAAFPPTTPVYAVFAVDEGPDAPDEMCEPGRYFPVAIWVVSEDEDGNAEISGHYLQSSEFQPGIGRKLGRPEDYPRFLGYSSTVLH